jgi:hypothetical protein
MAKGRSTIPAHLAGNAADCTAVIMQAMGWRLNPWAVAQKTHVVNGALGYEAQLVNAVIQNSGATEDRFNYEWYGLWENIIGKSKVMQVPAKGKYGDKDYKKAYEYRVPDYGMQDENGLGVRVWATIKGESTPRILDLLLVQASVRNSPLWSTDPKQQLAYLAVKRWARLYTPDVIMGVYTPDELDEGSPRSRDMGAAEVVDQVNSANRVDVKPMIAAVLATKTPAAARAYWSANNAKLLKQPEDSARFKAEMIAHGLSLKAKEDARTVENKPDPVPAATQAASEFDAVHGDNSDYVPE